MNDKMELSDWKTQAWSDAGMVSWYSGRMMENTGTNRLKNALEVGIINHQVRGKDVLDIGIGTGRAALPLVDQGYRVTGIDSSQAMLNETRRLAGNRPIALQLGDIFKLPFTDAGFDSAVSLNVLVHFPNWREALLEWKRVVRPGGRIVFDIHSRDHITAAYGDDPLHWPEALRKTESASDFNNYMSRASASEIYKFADEAGFAVAALIPYGAFLGGGNINWLMHEKLERTHKWRRTLSWFSRDAGLFELGLFLEEMIVSRLTPRVTGRMFVVLENRADPKGNAHWAKELAKKEAALNQLSFPNLQPWLPLTGKDMTREMARLLQPLRARHFFYLLLKSLTTYAPAYDFEGFLDAENTRQFSNWLTADALDQQVMTLARHWGDGCADRMYRDVDVTLGADYHLVDTLLANHYGIFGEVRK